MRRGCRPAIGELNAAKPQTGRLHGEPFIAGLAAALGPHLDRRYGGRSTGSATHSKFATAPGCFKSSKVRQSDTLTYAQLLPRALVNQVFVLLPAMVLVQWLGWAFTGPAHLGFWHFIALLAGMAIGHDIVQYVAHRYLLHDPRLMRVLGHSVHHTTGASKAISALYMAPMDFFLEIVLPYLLPLVVLGGGGSDILFQLLVAGLGAFGGLYEHSGYDFRRAFAWLANSTSRFLGSARWSKR